MQYLFRALIWLFLSSQRLFQSISWVFPALVRPVVWAWKRAVWPPFLWTYKHLVLLTQRWKIFSHSSHRLLSLVTHRFTLLLGVLTVCGGIVTANIVLANQPKRGPGQFAQGALVDQVVVRDNVDIDNSTEIVVTAKDIAPVQPQWWQQGGELKKPLPQNAIIVEEDTPIIENAVTGIALVPPASQGKTARTRTEIEEYVVEGGDTAGSIAAKFNLSMQTILDANDIEDPDLIKPGDTLKILPIDGVKYKWKKKDTLKKIAKRFGADIEDILEFNRIDGRDDIEVGQILIIPDGRIPEPTPDPVQTVPGFTELASVTPTPTPVAQPVAEPTPVVDDTPVDTIVEEPVAVDPVVEEPTVDEAAEVAEVVGDTTSTAGATGSLIWPTTTDRISQQYGYGHTGLDIDGEFGDPTYAADNGTVVSAGWSGAYGNMVVVDHGNGVVTRYAHLQSLYVSPGQAVSQGQNMGEQGSTGNSSGSHLHYEVMVNGQFVNPYSQ